MDNQNKTVKRIMIYSKKKQKTNTKIIKKKQLFFTNVFNLSFNIWPPIKKQKHVLCMKTKKYKLLVNI